MLCKKFVCYHFHYSNYKQLFYHQLLFFCLLEIIRQKSEIVLLPKNHKGKLVYPEDLPMSENI